MTLRPIWILTLMAACNGGATDATTSDLRWTPSIQLALDHTSITVGETLHGSVTYRNRKNSAVTVQKIVIIASLGSTQLEFEPALGPLTLAAGQRITLSAAHTFTSADPIGDWQAVSAVVDKNGVPHQSTPVSFTVSDIATPRDAGVDAAPAQDSGTPMDAATPKDSGTTPKDSGTTPKDSGAPDLAPPPPPPPSSDLCAGMVQDKLAHPMTALAKPALGQVATDAQFGTRMRRITQVAATGTNPAIVPLYSTVSAWNADETRLLLYSISGGGHQLYDGKSYQFIRNLDIDPPDLEQVYWHTSDPDILFYVSGKTLIRYHVNAGTKETLATFDFCSTYASNGSDPMFTSFDSKRIGLRCDGQVFIYDISTKTVLGKISSSENPAQVAPSGNFAYLSDSGRVTDAQLNVLRTLDLKEPYGHASLGRLPTGEDTWNGQVFDDGPKGNTDIGTLVSFKLTDGTSKVIIGPKTGYPYPPDGHISSLAYKRPGWAFVSTFGNTSGAGLLDMEMLIADTASGKVCRVGRHRSWGKANTHLGEPYWAEPHAVPSPTGTRMVFASDWGNGTTVDSYVLELPGYTP